MIKILLFLFLSFGLISSCQKEFAKPKSKPLNKEVINPDDIKTIAPEESQTSHKDIKYDYEYRSGTSGNYKYTYLVKGINQKGDSVSGVINISKKNGSGTIINKNKETIDIKVEWVDYSKLKAIDNDDNEYYLEAN